MSHGNRRGKCVHYRQNKVAMAQDQETVWELKLNREVRGDGDAE